MPGRRFPDGFRWGTATAAHQIEGGNVNNDWWAWEHDPDSGCKESSGDCCDSWHRWPEDVALLQELGFTDYRFSLEWSRIEPADGEFSNVALDHYARVCEGLREAGIAPVVTFHHFTTPRWLAEQGGWERDDMPERFAIYCERAAARLDGLMERACTIKAWCRPSASSAARSRPASATGTRGVASTRCSCARTGPPSTPSEAAPPACPWGSPSR
jgi:beta-glucosidase